MRKHGLKVGKEEEGDGFCFLNSVRTVLLVDHFEYYSLEDLQKEIIDFLIANPMKYIDAHGGCPDTVVKDAKDFFRSKQFDSDIVDVIIQATGDALGLKINIYRRSPAGSIRKIEMGVLDSRKEVNLKFSSAEYNPNNPTYVGANHYDPITRNESPTGAPTLKELDGEETPEMIDLTQASNSSSSSEIELIQQVDFMKSCDPNEVHITPEVEEKFLRPGTKFPVHLYEDAVPLEVDFLPGSINGNKAYKVKCSSNNYSKKTGDRRWFYMRTSSKSGFRGIVKVGTCLGSWECTNKNCSFLSTEGKPNWWHWEYKGGAKACYSCGLYAVQVHCGARKYVQHGRNADYATVFHLGKHKCQLQPDAVTDASYTRKWVEKFPGLSFSDLKTKVIQHHLDNRDINAAEEASYKISQQAYRKIRREVEDFTTDVDTHSFQAVTDVKVSSDKIDPYYIYKINSKDMNNTDDFVMKSCKSALELALKMDQDGDDILMKDADAFFDGCHSRCTGFISLGLWFQHPSMRRVLRIASCEVRTEKGDTIEIFFSLLNEMLQKVGNKDKDYKFNPKYIFNDEAGSNFVGISRVFGEQFAAERVITCQWHFMNQVNAKIHFIGEKDQEEFLKCAKNACIVPTIPEFEILWARMQEICNMYPQVGSFLDWYYVRRSHLFQAFRGGIHSGLNLAEVGNAKWKHKTRLSLVKAATDDICSMLNQESDLKRFNDGQNFQRGYAPNDIQRATKEKRRQMEHGRSFAQLLENQAALQMQMDYENDPEYFIPNKRAKHKPSKKGNLEGKNFKRKSSAATAPRPETLNEILEKLIRARSIDNGEAPPTAEPPQQEESGFPVLSSGPEPRPVKHIRSTKDFPNPPTITQANVCFNISKCQGCPQKIDIQNMKAPQDLLFKIQAIRPYLDKHTNIWKDKIANAYCHLSQDCLQKHNPDARMEDITITDELFLNLSDAHMQYLGRIGMLQHIISNKTRQVQQSTD